MSAKTYCIVRDSVELKQAIDYKRTQKEISLYRMAHDLQIEYTRIKLWNNGKFRLSQWNVIKIAKYLGIKVGIKIEIYD